MSLSSLLRKPGLGMATGKSQNPRPGDSMDAGDSRHQHPQLMLSVAYQACLSSPGNPPLWHNQAKMSGQCEAWHQRAREVL